MPEILSLALFERRNRMLLGRRKAELPPFAGQWLLPCAVVGSEESAEEALERHAFRDLGVEVDEQEFVETLYVEDEATGQRFVANVFRIVRHRGELRFRAESDYEDVRWLTGDELAQTPMPPPLRDWLQGDRQAPATAGPVAVPATAPPPNNRTAWNAIAGAYQERYRIPTDRLVYGPRCPGEEELRLLGDVSGLFARSEGIIPAPESAHAIRSAIDEALAAKEAGEARVILFNLSGHGHFDMSAYDRYFAGELEDFAYPEEAVREAMKAVPVV